MEDIFKLASNYGFPMVVGATSLCAGADNQGIAKRA